MLIRDTGTQMACHAIVYAIHLHYYTVNSVKKRTGDPFFTKTPEENESLSYKIGAL